MLIGFVLTLARQKVQANADAGGKSEGEGGKGVWEVAAADETLRELRLLSSQGSRGSSGKRVMRRHSHHGFGLRLYFQRLNLHRIWLKKRHSHSFKD